MFRLLGRKSEAKGTGSKPQAGSGGGEVAEDKGNAEQLFDQVNGLIEQRNASSSASVRSILKAAISSAEQIVDSVKTQVAAEARQEADGIIAEAKKEAEKIKGEKKPLPKEPAEDIASITEQVAEEKVAEPAPVPEEVIAEEEKPVPLPEVSAVVEPVAEVTEPKKTGKKRGAEAKEAPAVVLTKEESESLYAGEVELNVKVPIEPILVAKLYSYLQTTPELKFVRTAGSWNKGSIITIVLDKPVPLLAGLVAKLPEANILPERPEGKDSAPERIGVRRITISPGNQ
jgi:F0F1-type ATP synthase membrane subunit b/b'